MKKQTFLVVLEWDPDEQLWVTYVPSLNFLSTYGKSKEEAIANTEEAIVGYLEAASKEGMPASESNTEAEIVSLEISVA